MIKMIGGKTVVYWQSKRVISIFLFTFLSVLSSFSQENKKRLTNEYLDKHIDIISHFYDSYNIYEKNENKALDVFIKDLQAQHINDSIIGLIKHDLINYKSTELEKISNIKLNKQHLDYLIFFNYKVVTESLKEKLGDKFSSFYNNLDLNRRNSIISSRMIKINFNEFKEEGIIPARFENHKEYITYRLSSK